MPIQYNTILSQLSIGLEHANIVAQIYIHLYSALAFTMDGGCCVTPCKGMNHKYHLTCIGVYLSLQVIDVDDVAFSSLLRPCHLWLTHERHTMFIWFAVMQQYDKYICVYRSLKLSWQITKPHVVSAYLHQCLPT